MLRFEFVLRAIFDGLESQLAIRPAPAAISS
jgi:hypothetical protein